MSRRHWVTLLGIMHLVSLASFATGQSTTPSALLRPNNVVGSGNCTTPLLGPAQDCDLGILGAPGVTTTMNMTNIQIAGRVAVNGNTSISDFVIANGLNCTAANATIFNLIVQGNLNASSGEVFCGSALVSGTVTSPPTFRQTTEGAQVVHDQVSLSGVNFNFSVATLNPVNQAVCALNCTTVALDQSDSLLFTDNGENNPQIFCVDAGNLTQASSIVFDFRPNFNAPIVVNVQSSTNGTVNFGNAVINRGQLQASQFLWNVCNARNVSISKFQLIGSLLAPNSSVFISNAAQEGITVSATLSGQGFLKPHWVPFQGFFCQAA